MPRHISQIYTKQSRPSRHCGTKSTKPTSAPRQPKLRPGQQWSKPRRRLPKCEVEQINWQLKMRASPSSSTSNGPSSPKTSKSATDTSEESKKQQVPAPHNVAQQHKPPLQKSQSPPDQHQKTATVQTSIPTKL